MPGLGRDAADPWVIRGDPSGSPLDATTGVRADGGDEGQDEDKGKDDEDGGPKAGDRWLEVLGSQTEDGEEQAIDKEQAASISVNVEPARLRVKSLGDANAVGAVHGHAPEDERKREDGEEEAEAAVDEDGWDGHWSTSMRL